MKNKRGFELVWSNVVTIIIALILLALLVVFLLFEFGVFSSNTKGFTPSSNVDIIIKSCNSLASINSAYEFCCTKKELEINNTKLQMSCSEISNQSYGKSISLLNCNGVC